MKFIVSGPRATRELVREIELRLGFEMPGGLREIYLEVNGGVPERSSFLSDVLDASFALQSLSQCEASYRRLHDELHMIPEAYLPFGVDPGGDYWLVDCRGERHGVHFLVGEENALIDLKVGLDEFWPLLQPES